MAESIRIHNARQNTLKGFDLDLPLNKLIVITGVSGSGKSSLAFDTIYAEGQRRYVETFSPYARQFLDRMDKPRVDRIDGIPPAIAIDQTNPVRTSRSTVGTMTELNDHLKLLFSRAAKLFCRTCNKPVQRDTVATVWEQLRAQLSSENASTGVIITFSVAVPHNFGKEEVRNLLARQGYTRFLAETDTSFEVIQDRLTVSQANKARIMEDLEAAFTHGQGTLSLYPLGPDREPSASQRFSTGLHCADCDIHYSDPAPNTFSFNSPIGACETCRGFGRTIGIDLNLVIPDSNKSLASGAIKPWQTDSYSECQTDLIRFAKRRGIPTDRAWCDLTDAQRQWVIDGEGPWDDGVWYGVRRFFEWLEGRSYRMHVRVLLSRYRAYTPCPVCQGARLKPEALLWRIGSDAGMNIRDVMLLSIERCLRFFEQLSFPPEAQEAAEVVLKEILTRLRYLVDVGLGYLTLDRQSRTLSGGEVQRINLTTALGTSLVNTLFVLDEPSIGLHSRDIRRLIGVLRRLRDAGNTIIVVEHDPEVINAADWIVDMGPGPGEQGGEVVYSGTPAGLLKSKRSVTAPYLTGKRSVTPDGALNSRRPVRGYIQILGASENNLKNIDVRIPLGQLAVITGVSGSGKSTLMQSVCYNGLRKLLMKPVDPPGIHRAILGYDHIDDVVLVDQSAIGKTARSNPASYVGAFDEIRKLFCEQPLSKQRGYTAGTFSFNAGTGRCPTCNGSGFEHVEMQFLSDVYLRCPDCDGRRFRSEILEVTIKKDVGMPKSSHGIVDHLSGPAKSIADILDLTINQACLFFSDHPRIIRSLEPLQAVGLAYMKLGQPLPTLSGGEAQRLKLAGYLADASLLKSTGKGSLFLFDEPTTGLHFSDIATLLTALGRLIDRGHSVVVIEHNLDVIKAADWIIDLGPEGGEEGGSVIGTGTPPELMRCAASHTGQALSRYSAPGRLTSTSAVGEAPLPYRANRAAAADIVVLNAAEHNLKNIDFTIPRNKLTVITGVSGSGKSTIAFDILFNEGQRRYLESLNAYARQFVQPAGRPDVDSVSGIPPTVAIEQRTSRGGRKSTVATVTEIYHFLRLLFVKLGTQYCPQCDIPIQPQNPAAILAGIQERWRGKTVRVLAPLVVNRKGYYTDLAQWAAGHGYSHLRVDGALIATAAWPRLDRFKEHSIELPVGEIKVDPAKEKQLLDVINTALEHGKGVLYVLVNQSNKTRTARSAEAVLFSSARSCPRCQRSFDELDPRLFSFNSKHGWCAQCFGTGLQMNGFDAEQTGEEIWWNAWWDGSEHACPACNGRRLRPEALAVRFQGQPIDALTALPVTAALRFFHALKLLGREAEISRDIIGELESRLAFLEHVGLAYLSLDRAAPTLSGGEAQRIRLAAQLGSNLRGVCYILDEPTIGLHSRDNLMLLDTLQMLKAKGNTVVVVEHDAETIRRAEYIIDLGPGGGTHGGEIMAQGNMRQLLRAPRSTTAKLLHTPLRHPLLDAVRPMPDAFVEINNANLHNIKGMNARIPIGRLVAITGVSGSGKSTLVRDILFENLHRLVGRKRSQPVVLHGCSALTGWERIDRVLEVDQSPIGRTPRSCPATYVGFWDHIRKLFAATTEANLRGYTASRFSFNVNGGRCPVCEGQGIATIEMNFLPDVTVTCEACAGNRFTAETLNVRFKDKTIADVLHMSVDDAVEFFASHRHIHHPLKLLQDVGLGYITLGQQSPTLSGGEAQRIKLVTELARVKPSLRGASDHTLYVLDEPTIGLHMADVEKLIRVLHRLVDSGNTIVVIEHNLDVIAEADWIIDLGPEGGDGGGKIVVQGPVKKIVHAAKRSHTAQFLGQFLLESAK
jgi:excinuclease ABC subunit A